MPISDECSRCFSTNILENLHLKDKIYRHIYTHIYIYYIKAGMVTENAISQIQVFIFFSFSLVNRYRQILEKAIQLSGAQQLEALKAFVEASKCI